MYPIIVNCSPCRQDITCCKSLEGRVNSIQECGWESGKFDSKKDVRFVDAWKKAPSWNAQETILAILLSFPVIWIGVSMELWVAWICMPRNRRRCTATCDLLVWSLYAQLTVDVLSQKVTVWQYFWGGTRHSRASHSRRRPASSRSLIVSVPSSKHWMMSGGQRSCPMVGWTAMVPADQMPPAPRQQLSE